jgi:monoamine oxidase
MRSTFARLFRRYGRRITGTERQQRVQRKIDGLNRRFAAVDAHAPRRRARGLKAKLPRVVIIGGGFAGLMTAYKLLGHSDVTVFEARERVGGRVWTHKTASGLFEAGGELIGYNHPQWLALAKQFELGLSVTTTDSNYDSLDLELPVYLEGKKLAEHQMKKIYNEMGAAFSKMARQAKAIKNPYRPWLRWNAIAVDQTPLSAWIGALKCSKLAKRAITQQFANDGGLPTHKQSLLGTLTAVAGAAQHGAPNDYFTQTEALRCCDGNAALAGRLLDEIARGGGTVQLHSPVRAIEIRKDEVSIDLERDGTMTADYVVLAIPPSLWPQSRGAKIVVTPDIPADYYTSMGTAVKYLSRLTHRFWIGEGLAPSATSDRFGVTWEGSDNQIQAPGRGVELSLFAGADMAKRGLDEYRRGGDLAVRAFYDRRIGAVYRSYSASVSGRPSFIPWPLDEWTGAGYSCPGLGDVCRAGPLLSRSFKQRMFFAGEHVCLPYFGYMEGALQSGRMAAAAILQRIIS